MNPIDIEWREFEDRVQAEVAAEDTTSGAAPQQVPEQPTPEADAAPGGMLDHLGQVERGVGRLEPERANACKLTECQGKPMCKRCAHWAAKPFDEGDLWSFLRTVMTQGVDIWHDHNGGRASCYEHYSARLDAAAAERAKELWAYLKTPNGPHQRETTAPTKPASATE
jgi:hypothetical protein